MVNPLLNGHLSLGLAISYT